MSESEALKKSWKLLEERRFGPKYPAGFHGAEDAICKLIESGEVELTIDEAYQLTRKTSGPTGQYFAPNNLVKFARLYLSKLKPHRLLDPHAVAGLSLLQLIEGLSFDEAVAIHTENYANRLAQLIGKGKSIRWLEGKPSDLLETLEGEFDAIVSNPPLGLRPSREKVELPNGETLEVHDDESSVLVLRSCLKLSRDGVGMFVLSPKFFWDRAPLRVLPNLEKAELSVDAVLHIPAGSFAPFMNIACSFAIIRKGEQGQVFIGELSDSEEHIQVLTKNLLERKTNKDLALGALVSLGEFRSFEALRSAEQLNRMIERTGMTPLPLKQVVMDVQLPKKRENPFEEKANTVYLPSIGNSKAVTSMEDLRIKPQNYIQLTIDAKVANPRYLAEYFNSPLGHQLRATMMAGGVIPRITKTSLNATEDIFLPDLDVQIEALETDNKIATLTSELNELRKRIWDRPKLLGETIRQLKRVNREERFPEWLDTLPFPLASVLWSYHAAQSDHRKQEGYLHFFFEALAEFLAVILLSPYYNDEKHFVEVRKMLSNSLLRVNQSLEVATFGTWVTIVGKLAKHTRKKLGNEEGREVCKAIFNIRDTTVLERLCSSSLVALLGETNKLRNEWRGHGGVVSEVIAKERNIHLQSYLAKVREFFGDVWERCELVQPHTNRFLEGTYETTVHRVMGTRTPFEQKQVFTTEPLEDGRLHLIGADERQVCKLLPFIKITSSPGSAENACYFYSRSSSGESTYVSYHYEQQPKHLSADGNFLSLLKMFDPAE